MFDWVQNTSLDGVPSVGLPSNLIRILEIIIVFSCDVRCFREIIRTVSVNRMRIFQLRRQAVPDDS